MTKPLRKSQAGCDLKNKNYPPAKRDIFIKTL